MDLGDFLVQIPFQLILMVCGSGLLFIVAVVIIAQRRNRRKAAQRDSSLLSAVPAPDSAPAEPPAPNAATESGPNLASRAWQAVHDFFFYSEEERAERERAKTEASASVAPAASSIPTPSAPPEAVEVLHLWRDVADGGLIIQIGDETYRTMGDITAAGQERRFMAVLRELARIAKETAGEMSAPPVSAPPVMPPPQPTPPPTAPVEEASPLPADTPPIAAEPPVPAEAPDPEPELPAPEVADMIKAARQEQPRPSLTSDMQSQSNEPESEALGSFFSNVRDAVRRGGRGPAKGPEAPSLTIADEIEEFLQARLRTAPPELERRRIHVRPAYDGGVRIEVDGQFFEAVGDIEDEDVRTYVIDTIQAWEASR